MISNTSECVSQHCHCNGRSDRDGGHPLGTLLSDHVVSGLVIWDAHVPVEVHDGVAVLLLRALPHGRRVVLLVQDEVLLIASILDGLDDIGAGVVQNVVIDEIGVAKRVRVLKLLQCERVDCALPLDPFALNFPIVVRLAILLAVIGHLQPSDLRRIIDFLVVILGQLFIFL